MTHITRPYSENWKTVDDLLIYKSSDFIFKPHVLITEIDQCLIQKISANRIYTDPDPIKVYNEDLIKQLRKDSVIYSICIISNQLATGKTALDFIKFKTETCISMIKIPVIVFYARRPNKLSKPYTGMWNLMKSYFASNNTQITSGLVVNDIDRAFAHNIDIPYKTIKEYLGFISKEKFTWSTDQLTPDQRRIYLDRIRTYQNPDLIDLLSRISTTFLIMVYGAPRSGKSTMINQLLSEWSKTPYSRSSVIKVLDIKKIKVAQKYLLDRINVIIDGGGHTTEARRPYEEFCLNNQIKFLCIEVNPGMGMAYLLNHVAVETAKDLNTTLYPYQNYYLYKSVVQRPEGVIMYCPKIIESPELMDFRY